MASSKRALPTECDTPHDGPTDVGGLAVSQPCSTAASRDSKRGRKSGGLGNWSVIEDTAAVLAAVDACEQKVQASDGVREASAAAAFPTWMQYCRDDLKLAWHDRVVGNGAAKRIITFEVCCVERASCGVLVKRFKAEFLKFACNVIMVGFHSFLNKDGELPSGTTRDDHEKHIKEHIWKHEFEEKQLSKAKKVKKLTETLEAEGEEQEGEDQVDQDGIIPPDVGQDTSPAMLPTMPEHFDGGRWFPAWKELGPWGRKHPSLAETTVEGLPQAVKSDSRAAMKAAAINLEDGCGKLAGSSSKVSQVLTKPGDVSYARIDEKDLEMQRHRALMKVRENRIKELTMLLKFRPNPEAEQKLVELLSSDPPAVPDL